MYPKKTENLKLYFFHNLNELFFTNSMIAVQKKTRNYELILHTGKF